MNCNCNNGFMGCGNNSWWIILIIFFLFCGCGNSCGCGCGCRLRHRLSNNNAAATTTAAAANSTKNGGRASGPFPLGKNVRSLLQKRVGQDPSPLQQALFITGRLAPFATQGQYRLRAPYVSKRPRKHDPHFTPSNSRASG